MAAAAAAAAAAEVSGSGDGGAGVARDDALDEHEQVDATRGEGCGLHAWTLAASWNFCVMELI